MNKHTHPIWPIARQIVQAAVGLSVLYLSVNNMSATEYKTLAMLVCSGIVGESITRQMQFPK